MVWSCRVWGSVWIFSDYQNKDLWDQSVTQVILKKKSVLKHFQKSPFYLYFQITDYLF